MKKWDHKAFTIYAHWKRDGYNLHLVGGRAMTRKPLNWTDRLSWHPGIHNILQSGVEVYGELYLPHGRASDVVTAINNQDERLRFGVFTVPHLGDMTLFEVARWVTEQGWDRLGLQTEYIPFYMHADSMLGIIPTWEQYVIIPGCEGGYYGITEATIPPEKEGYVEGFVMRNHNGEEGTKWKLTHTIDLIVDSVTEGKGKHAGKIGALVCRTYEGHVIANCGQMTDHHRALGAEKWLNQVVEVEYDYMGNGGKLRFPRLVRVRIDKPHEQCTVDQSNEIADFYQEV